jgi:phosphoribosylaminoimidazole carboxylase (NCAIR synthetase)
MIRSRSRTVSFERPLTILCVASHLKGFHFMREAHRLGCKVYLLTHEKHLAQPWPREVLEDVFALPNFDDPVLMRHVVSHLYRTLRFDRMVPLGDYDVEVTGALREHLRMPGMGVTASLHWRDKLAMRIEAARHGVPVPAFSGLFHHGDVASYMERVPGPWVLKPRMEAGSKGVSVIHAPHELWQALSELGDEQSQYLLERFVEGDVYHVDGVVHCGKVVFASVQKYGAPMLALRQSGGVYSTRTIARGTPEEKALQALNKRVVQALGLPQGVTHIEYLHDRRSGEFLFLEAACRVGAAKIPDVVHAATGVCLWHEWAKLETAGPGHPYVAPRPAKDHAGVVISLADQEHPDTSAYDDPEIVWRKPAKPYHVGLLFKSKDPARIEELAASYAERIARDFSAHAPAH